MAEQRFNLTIESLGSHGEGVGHLEGYTLFVDGALPGETVEVQMTQRHKRYGRAELLAITEVSPYRVEPPCRLFGTCGGCQLMHLSYAQQLEIKRQRVVDALQRIGKIKGIDVPACLPSPAPLAYRNKIQLPVRQGKADLAIGLYARSSHTLVEVDACPIHCTLGDTIYQKVSALIKQSGIKAYDPETGQGELRHLLIKSAVHTQQVLVILVTHLESQRKTLPLAKTIMEQCPLVKGVVQNINSKNDNVILGTNYHLLAGSGHIQEALGDLLFKVSPASFFQVNPDQALRLYAKAVEFAGLTGDETVLDAYCGVGTLSLFFAKHVKKVIGVECVREAIVDAKENALLNDVRNASFVCQAAEIYIRSLPAVDVVVLNPPRKGCDPVVLQELERLRPKTIVYISCDPSTLARDLAHLVGSGYHLEEIQPFDMFPQTAHVECVAKLENKKD